MASKHREQRIVASVACPKCGAPIGDPCGYKHPDRPVVHGARRAAWQATQQKRVQMTPDDFRRARKALGLTQIALAQRMGAGRRTIQNWESGERKIPEIAVKLLATLEPRAVRRSRSSYRKNP